MLGFLRTLLVVVIISVLSFLGNAANLNGLVSAGMATVIAGLAMSLEHYIESKTGSALFGAFRTR